MNKGNPPVKAQLVKLEESVHQVRGYGTMVIGLTVRVERPRRWMALMQCSGEQTAFPTQREAREWCVQTWQSRFSGQALAQRFEDRTRGGFPVRFEHQFMDRGAGISAVVSYGPGQRASTSFFLDGRCALSDQADWDLIPKSP